MSPVRKCPCGCGDVAPPAGGKQVYAHVDRCRKRAYRKRVRAAADAAGLPASPSLRAIEASTTTKVRPGDAQKSSRTPQTRRSGLQVSYLKATDACRQAVTAGRAAPGKSSTELAEHFMRGALSERQRAALDTRRAA